LLGLERAKVESHFAMLKNVAGRSATFSPGPSFFGPLNLSSYTVLSFVGYE